MALPLAARLRSPRPTSEVLRNAFLTTFICVLAVYPALDRGFHLQTLGSMNPILIFIILALGLNIVVGFAGLLDLGYAAFFAIGGYTAAFLTSPSSPLWRCWRAGSSPRRSA
jgi:ABC-type branched-subunit amino acid transport system permease subunit